MSADRLPGTAAERYDRIRVGVDVVVLALASGDADGDPPRVQVYLWREPPQDDRLPGVALQPAEDLEAAAARVLALVGVIAPRHVEQLASFGAPDRVPGVRTMSVSYLALLPDPTPVVDDGHDGRWVDLADLAPPAGFTWDHGAILQAGLHRVRSKLGYSTIAYGLLPDAFTLSELQEVYEAVLGTTLDKRNFRKRVAGLGVLVETGELRRGPHRPAKLHAFATPEMVVLDDPVLRTP